MRLCPTAAGPGEAVSRPRINGRPLASIVGLDAGFLEPVVNSCVRNTGNVHDRVNPDIMLSWMRIIGPFSLSPIPENLPLELVRRLEPATASSLTDTGSEDDTIFFQTWAVVGFHVTRSCLPQPLPGMSLNEWGENSGTRCIVLGRRSCFRFDKYVSDVVTTIQSTDTAKWSIDRQIGWQPQDKRFESRLLLGLNDKPVFIQTSSKTGEKMRNAHEYVAK